jgi:hypothetical protein
MSETIEIPVEDLLYMRYSLPVAIIKKLYPIIGKEETLKLVKETVWENILKPSGAEAKVGSWEEFQEMRSGPDDTRSELVKKTTEREGFEKGEKEFSFRIVKCLWSKVFEDLGAPEIGEAMVCEGDFPYAKSLNPNLEIERTQTIMMGAPFCDFRFLWKK